MDTDLIDGYLTWLRSGADTGRPASTRTVDDRRDILLRLDRDLPFGLVATEEELRAWLWQDGWKVGTRETYYGCMASFYRWAAMTGELSENPTLDIARPQVPQRLPRPVSDEELRIVLTSAQPYKGWAILAAYEGARCIEISRLGRVDINQERTRLLGKGAKTRFVPTHPVVWEEFCDYPPGPITEHDERYISIRSAIYFRRSLRLAGVSLHRLRHWFGTNVQRRNKDIRVTQELMGHANPSTTALYSLVADEDKETAIGLLPDLVAGELDDDAKAKRVSSAR